MEWRCEWCGKPHEENDPPCDNCGHGSFEKAIVRQVAGDTTDADSMTVWVCTECGREHPKNSPPCSQCNNATLERETVRIDESNLTDAPGTASSVDGVTAETTTVWVCEECGREHPKHSPPCSRCGSTALSREEKQVSDAELAVPSYFDLVTPKYAAALVGVLLLATLFGLGAFGIVDVPGFPSEDVPTVEDVPGNDSVAGDVSLAAVEQAHLDALNDGREAAGLDRLERTEGLDDVAAFTNQQTVTYVYADGDQPEREQLRELLANECDGAATSWWHEISQDEAADAQQLGEQFAETLTAGDGWDDSEFELTGVDVHSVDDQLVLYQYFCY